MPDEANSTSNDSDASGDDTGTDTGSAETTDWKAEAEKWQSLARKHEGRAKANADAAKELEKVRQQAMTEQERAVAEAMAAGRAEAQAMFAAKLADAEFRAAAAGRIDGKALDRIVGALDLSRFVDEDGDPDRKAIAEFIDGIAPAAPKDADRDTRPAFLDLGQGARGGDDLALNGDPLLRDLKATLGIR